MGGPSLLALTRGLLVTMLLFGGCASNNSEIQVTQPNLVIINPGPPRVGPWHCFRVDENLQPWDERYSCNRDLDRCKWMRGNAMRAGLAATTCQKKQSAFCSMSQRSDGFVEACSMTGIECERHHHALKQHSSHIQHRPCAEVASESAPTSTNTRRRRWRR